ncbi:MAG TPA: MOSC domain-containing protein [Phycisphaerae bacterium]|nr:MOSC domain-containing protein [Phycisphaerae bacterium]
MKVLGRVESVWRYPVKSMGGEQLREVFAGFPGVYGDRAYALHSSAAIRGFPYFTAREQSQMLRYRATYRHSERMAMPPNLAEAEALGPGVTPLYAAPADWSVDVVTPSGEVLAVEDPRLIEYLRDGGQEGLVLSLMRSERALTDCRPVSLISMQSVRQLSEEVGVELDKLRFRANFYIDLAQGEGYSEDAWIGRRLRIGAKLEIMVLDRDPRCKLITLDPDTGQSNPNVLRCVAKEHGGTAGVYAVVLVEGAVRTGDELVLLE